MPDFLSQVLALPGLGWLIAAAFVAGTIRGFTGFGTALIYMPVAAQVLDPLWAIISVMVMDVFGPLPNLPKAFRTADKPDLIRLVGATAVTLPIGLWVLGLMSPDLFQIIVSVLALVMLACLLGGLRYRGRVGPKLVTTTGGLAGFLGGVSGMPGPPVILLYLAGPNPANVVRASTMTYLFLYDVVLMVIVALKGALLAVPVGVGLLMALPNLLGNMLGGLIFRPEFERIYRNVAYSVIGAAALSGLPIWG